MGRVSKLTVSIVLYPLEHARGEIGRALNASSRWALPDIHGFGAYISMDFHVTVAVQLLALRRAA